MIDENYAEGKVLSFQSQDTINTNILECFPYKGERQLIEYKTSEFSAVCPFSGLPDIADIEITYIPQDNIVELKSLKYYFVSFRNVGIYQEDATNRIFKDIFDLLSPQYLKVFTKYNTRGGIDASCAIEKGTK